MEISENLMALAKQFNSNGATLYMVGGAVRNSLMNLPVTDIDICGKLLPKEVESVAKKCGYKCQVVNEKLGTCLITVSDAEQYEYSTFRKEAYSHGHTPDSVTFVSDIKVDAKRRDFTIGAIYYDILKQEYIDIYNGELDIKNKVIRTVETPEYVFSADGLRILRLVRFATELDFKIDKFTLLGAKNHVRKLNEISPERKLKELKLILYSDFRYGNVNNCIKYFNKLNVNKYLFKCDKFKFKTNRVAKIVFKTKLNIRCLCFCLLLLMNKYKFKYIHPSQIHYDVQSIFGQSGLKESNAQVNSIIATYNLLQAFKFKKTYTIKELTDYKKLDDKCKMALSVFVPTDLIENHITKIELSGIPLSEDKLNVSNEELLAVVEAKNLSEIKTKLLHMCMAGKLKNEKENLLHTAKQMQSIKNNNK
ncbi:MAG: CCA tRNA nucleotidyltransferase [Clostridia bacterium]|nr:CCA tRNA nucleotidyltransferase [Clostridia bacterium]